MDIETLTNHISKLGKKNFESACKLILKDVFSLIAINVDGAGDGGTDYSAFNKNGEKQYVGYQITTQKSDIQRKAYLDAKKAIKNLGINKFYFFTTISMSETDVRKLENKIHSELGIATTCITSRHVAGMIIEENLLNKFLDENDYPLPKEFKSTYSYREKTIHSYTIFSDDASQMKTSIYDDTILFVLSGTDTPLSDGELLGQVKDFLSLNEAKEQIIERRLGALFGKNKIIRTEDGLIALHSNSIKEIKARSDIYEIELSNLSAAQIDLLRNEYNSDWTEEDSKKVALWIANATISDQINNLKEVGAKISNNPIFNAVNNGIEKLRDFLVAEKKIDKKSIDELVVKLLQMASNHPLITKIARASIYLALEGANPISSAKALGANRWTDFQILVDTTVAIRYSCSQLYEGYVNRYFNLSIKSINQAKDLGARLCIPHFYINECAAHLLRARRYDGINLDARELAYSSNAFIANYYALQQQGVKLPPTFMDYLSTFSPAIRTERSDTKDWIRAIMTDMQSILSRAQIELVEVPFYSKDDCKDFELEYMFHLNKFSGKKGNLIMDDIYALQFTNDRVVKYDEHWIILTWDTSMISISKSSMYKGWITNPIKFLDFTESTKPLSDTKLVSLVHSFAKFSERTLAAGARIIDRVLTFAAPEMQNWEFKQEMEKFKLELLSSMNLEKAEFLLEVEKKTDEFLKQKGIDLKQEIIEEGE